MIVNDLSPCMCETDVTVAFTLRFTYILNMSYTGYTEGTFSAQINDSRVKVQSLEQQVAQLTETLFMRDHEIKSLQNLLQKYINNTNTTSCEKQVIETLESSSVENKTKTKQK